MIIPSVRESDSNALISKKYVGQQQVKFERLARNIVYGPLIGKFWETSRKCITPLVFSIFRKSSRNTLRRPLYYNILTDFEEYISQRHPSVSTFWDCQEIEKLKKK
jgi:hypothetical protein